MLTSPLTPVYKMVACAGPICIEYKHFRCSLRVRMREKVSLCSKCRRVAAEIQLTQLYSGVSLKLADLGDIHTVRDLCVRDLPSKPDTILERTTLSITDSTE